MNRYEKIMRY